MKHQQAKTIQNLTIIGGGPAGITAALRARELGATVTLVERGRLGGTCTNDGCAPTRVLAKAARLVRESEQFRHYGLQIDPPTVDLAELMTHVQQTIYRLQEKKQLLANLYEAGVTIQSEVGKAHFVNPHTLVCESGLSITSDQFILCVGGQARRIRFPGSELALTHSDIWTLDHLPRSIVIVGAAATGCQLASIFASFGSQTTLLELAPRLLPAEDRAISSEITDVYRSRGIGIAIGIGGVRRLERAGTNLHLHYDTPTGPSILETEAVIMATGWTGNLAELTLEEAGVKTDRGYVTVNDYLQTSAPHIWAAGDITGRMMLVQSANYEARVAAENAALGAARSYEHRIVPHGGFTDPEYGSVGLTEEQAQAHEPDCLVTRIPYSQLDRAIIDNRPIGFCKLIVSARSRQLLGAHVVGEQAVEVVQLVATAMAAGMPIEQLAELELAYPTFTEIVGLAARRLVRQLNLVPLSPQWQALGQPTRV